MTESSTFQKDFGSLFLREAIPHIPSKTLQVVATLSRKLIEVKDQGII
jgi:hypothetical protein